MPTNKERSLAAASLRYVAEHGAPEWETIACCIADCLGMNDYPLWENGDKLFDLLANLIEPEPERTCRMKKRESKYVLSGWWECDECGIVYPPCNDEIATWALQYCPRCGAEVVKND